LIATGNGAEMPNGEYRAGYDIASGAVSTARLRTRSEIVITLVSR
jgi:hypothetical protein